MHLHVDQNKLAQVGQPEGIKIPKEEFMQLCSEWYDAAEKAGYETLVYHRIGTMIKQDGFVVKDMPNGQELGVLYFGTGLAAYELTCFLEGEMPRRINGPECKP